MQHRSRLLGTTVLAIGLVPLTLFALSSIPMTGAPVAAQSLPATPQRPFTNTITTPNSPSDLVFGTYLLAGPPRPVGIFYDVRDMAVDGAGGIYVAGATNDPAFPMTPGLEHVVENGNKLFVAKFSPDVSTLVYSTVLPVDDAILAVDPAGAVYLTGHTYDENFPVTPGAYATTCKISGYGYCDDAFVMKPARHG